MDQGLFADGHALVLDPDPQSRSQLLSLLRQLGLRAHPAESPGAARARFASNPPDLFILTRHFRGEDTLPLVRELRGRDPAHWIGILMLDEARDSHGESEALAAGCDDFAIREGAAQVLIARLGAILRMRKLRRFSEFQRAELLAYREQAEGEADLTRFLLSRLSRVEHLEAAGVSYHWVPAQGFSGDLLAATRSHTGDLYGMLADATGHGLAAAIHLIPLTTAFYAMAGKGFNLEAIAGQLNTVVKDYSLPDRFMAVTLARLSARERRVELVNAGNPPALVVSRDRRIVREFDSGSVPLGILEGTQFHPRVEAHELVGDEELLMFSDGIAEATSFEGEVFGRQRILDSIAHAHAGREGLVRSLREALEAHCIGVPPADDISLMVLRSPLADVPAAVPGSISAAAASDRTRVAGAADSPADKCCRVEIAFSSAELQRVDVVPVVVDLTRSIGLRRTLESRFFTILSELYVNALDHGLLGMDSALKAEPDGLERYFLERSERLATLDTGEITIRLDHRYRLGGGGRMRIAVSDSGRGFDHQRSMRALLHPELDEGAERSGRGLSLLLSLCDSVQFNASGNTATVEFRYD